MSKKKITELEERINFLEKVIDEKDEQLRKYQDNFLLNSFNFISSVIDEYSIWLNPEKQEFHATFKGKTEVFKISVSNIIGIYSSGRLKECYLYKGQNPIGDEKRITNLIYSNSNEENLNILLNLLDKQEFFLLKIGRDKLINVKYFDLSNGILNSNANRKNINKELQTIKLNKKQCIAFASKKEMFIRIYSLQKLFVRYKAQFGIPI